MSQRQAALGAPSGPAPSAGPGRRGDLLLPLLAMAALAAVATALGLWDEVWWLLLAAEFALLVFVAEAFERRLPFRRRQPYQQALAWLFPLLLLETLRDSDRPEEILEDEDVTISLPRRLGLSDVVMSQIRHFQDEVRGRRLQSAASMMDLVRLVVRRPDAEAIFVQAGRRVAQHAWQQRSGMSRSMLRVTPTPLSRGAARRAARRLFKKLVGDGQLSVGRWPVVLTIRNSLTARADPSGAACAFYAGAFSEIMELHTRRRYRVLHEECIARGAPACLWTVETEG